MLIELVPFPGIQFKDFSRTLQEVSRFFRHLVQGRSKTEQERVYHFMQGLSRSLGHLIKGL